MTSTHDATSLTESLVDWVRSVRPDANVRIVSGKAGSNGSPKPKSDKEIAVRLGRVEGLSGPRSGDAEVNMSGVVSISKSAKRDAVDRVCKLIERSLRCVTSRLAVVQLPRLHG